MSRRSTKQRRARARRRAAVLPLERARALRDRYAPLTATEVRRGVLAELRRWRSPFVYLQRRLEHEFLNPIIDSALRAIAKRSR